MCYDDRSHVFFSWYAPELRRRFTITLPCPAASVADEAWLCPPVDCVENLQGVLERFGRDTALRPKRMVEHDDNA